MPTETTVLAGLLVDTVEPQAVSQLEGRLDRLSLPIRFESTIAPNT